MTYLDDAAAEITKARQANGKREADTTHLKDETHPVRAEIRAERMRIIDRLIAMAAVERNLPPCYHAVRPEPEQETP